MRQRRPNRLTRPFMLSLLLAALLFAPVTTSAEKDDWPQWRGEGRDGKSAETGLLTSWPEGGPTLLWRSEGAGAGYASLSVSGDRIFTMGDVDGSQFVIAFDRNDGTLLWKREVGPEWEDRYGGPRGTPTVSGDRLYAISTQGTLVCLDTATGEEHWRRSLTGDFGGKMAAGNRVDWKFSESPLLDGDRVIVTPGMPEAVLAALSASDGSTLWRSPMPSIGDKGADGAAYSSVVVSEGAGVRQYIQLTGRGVIGVAAQDGRFLWGYNRIANHVANIPTPLVHGDHVFVSTGYNTGAALLRLERSQDSIQAREVYFLPANTLQNHHGQMILHEGHVYAGTGHGRGFPISVEFETGQVKWGPSRNAGKGSAAVVFADGHLYFRYQSGLMMLIEATPEAYREKGSFMIPDVNNFSWSHPVISDQKLYLREQDHLLCYDLAPG